MTDPWLLMTYNRDADCWMVHIDGRSYTMHCGEWFEIQIHEDKGMICCLEMDRDWFVIVREARFYLRKKDTYHIHI